jgi:hypothetical protein
MARFLPVLAAALGNLTMQGMKASKAAIEDDPGVAAYATQKAVRTLITLLEENDLVAFEGKTRDRSCRLTPKGQLLLATRNDEKAQESHR